VYALNAAIDAHTIRSILLMRCCVRCFRGLLDEEKQIAFAWRHM
jgi:hypothetical protein